MVELQMTTWRMRIACWMTKATNTRSECLFFFFTETVVTRTPLSVTLHVQLPVLCNASTEKKAYVFGVFLGGVTKISNLMGNDAA
jgi:hypothetical protein